MGHFRAWELRAVRRPVRQAGRSSLRVLASRYVQWALVRPNQDLGLDAQDRLAERFWRLPEVEHGQAQIPYFYTRAELERIQPSESKT